MLGAPAPGARRRGRRGSGTRLRGGRPGVLITVHDPDDPASGLHNHDDGRPAASRVWRFVPEVGNTGSGGGAYLLLASCASCGGEEPMAAISSLADLGLYMEHTGRRSPDASDPDNEDGQHPEVPIEFFGDPGHEPACPDA